MVNGTTTLYCPNYNCQAPNPETHRFCQKCRSFLPKHYLWAIGDNTNGRPLGDVLADRYVSKGSRIFLDAKPGLPPQAPYEIPQFLSPYLRLSPFQLHVPQVYDLVRADDPTGSDILLLDHAALFVPSASAPDQRVGVQLLLPLSEVWAEATALRQLNWLWQIAYLWQPLMSEYVGSSLLQPELLRVEGPILRLLQLSFDDSDANQAPTLARLGQLWSSWAATAQPAIASFLQQICQQLIQGQIQNTEQLIDRLDEALVVVGKQPSRQIQIATGTDQGPSRQRNEDACYPPGGTYKSQTLAPDSPDPAQDTSLVIVCDGIGGHQGGDVASNLAIDTIWNRLQPLRPDTLKPPDLIVELEKATFAANDTISQRNDSEQRFDRQRMGTTLVMGLLRTHELYTTHVGDSRAYWITRWGCHQVTLDDDIASREVRLGYGFYREALQQPSAGSLVQALGMASSTSLHPTVQRFLLDEDCIFLLCSDGLSDNDLVDQCWDTVLLPVLNGTVDLAGACQQLVETANTRNGHDNVTVGLIYCRVNDPGPGTTALKLPPTTTTASPPLEPSRQMSPDLGTTAKTIQVSRSNPSTLKTQVITPPRRRSPNPLPLLLGILVLLGLGGLLLYVLVPPFSRWVDPLIGLEPAPQPEPEPPAPVAVPDDAPDPTGLTTLEVGAYIQVNRRPVPIGADDTVPLLLLPQPGLSDAAPSPTPEATPAGDRTTETGGEIQIGSVLQVLSKQGTAGGDRWVRLQVCSVSGIAESTPPTSAPTDVSGPGPTSAPSASPGETPRLPLVSADPPLLQPGEEGWIQEAAIAPLSDLQSNLTPTQRGECTPSPLPAPPDSGAGLSSPQTTPSVESGE